MSKRTVWIILLLTTAVPAQAAGFADRFSLRAGPGGLMALSGQYTDSTKLGKAVNIGAQFGGGLRYRFNDYLAAEARYAFGWMPVKKAERPYAYKEGHPAFNLQMLTLNGMLFLSSGYKFDPYLTAGVGIYPWMFSGTALGGEAWPAPGNRENSFSALSPGLNAGAGVDIFLFAKCFLFAEVQYHYVFARNVGKLGTDDFTQQDFLGLNVGLVFKFGKR